MAKDMRQPIESGCPDGFQYMHPLMVKNFGQWRWHDHPRPGVLRHVADSGDEVWTVKAGTQRILDVFTLRKLCDIGDEFADGHVRFTIRSNIEYMVAEEAKVEPLIDALEDAGFVVGGTANSVAMISHTQGWLHCDIPGTDASGVVKAMMDELIDEFKNCNMPNRVHITTSCCQINCGGQGDIAINVQHTKPPKINHDLVANVCERPSVVARCPVAAIRPAQVNGKPTLEVDEKNVSAAAPAIRLAHRCRSTILSTVNSRSGLAAITPTRAASRVSRNWSPQGFQTTRRAGRKPRLSSSGFCSPTKMTLAIGSESMTGSTA